MSKAKQERKKAEAQTGGQREYLECATWKEVTLFRKTLGPLMTSQESQ